MALMKAVRIHSYGGPEVLVYEDAPKPEAAAGEVLVRVHAAGVNPMDWKLRQGYMKDRLHHRLPLILGGDVSGIVEATGSGVTAFKVGDAVYGFLGFVKCGGYAEYAAADAAYLAPKPGALGHIQAAGVPLTALVAWQALFENAGLSPGQTVLIHGASGGVGHMAVQLAKWKGARVIGTASAKNAEFLKKLGVDVVVDYHAARFEDVARDVDVVLDTQGGETQQRSWPILKKGGILVATVGVESPDTPAKYGVRGVSFMHRPDGGQLRQIGKLIEDGVVVPAVSTVMPLNEAAKAHELSQTGHARGKIVLKIRD